MEYCTAHKERTGEQKPVYKLGLCKACYEGRPIKATVETVGANYGFGTMAERVEKAGKDRQRKRIEKAKASDGRLYRSSTCPVCGKPMKPRATTCRKCWQNGRGRSCGGNNPFLLDSPLTNAEIQHRKYLRKKGVDIPEVYNIAHRTLRSALARA